MKKISIITTAAVIALAFVSTAYANKQVRTKPKTSTSSGAATAPMTAVGAANAGSRQGLPGVGVSGQTEMNGAGNLLLNGAASVNTGTEFGGACRIGDGVTLLSKAKQAIVGRAVMMGIGGGEGCLASLPDSTTAEGAVDILEAGVNQANRLGISTVTSAGASQKHELLNAIIASMQSELGVDSDEAMRRFNGICKECDVFSPALCEFARN